MLLAITITIAAMSSTIFLFSKNRINFKEVEDSNLFNIYFPNIAEGMLYDMSHSQTYFNNKIPIEFSNKIIKKQFIDLGSGGGLASVHHLKNFFGPDVKIILTDLYPKVELWAKLETDNIKYISEPVNNNNLKSYLKPDYNLSLFGSLHHMDINSVNSIFKQVAENNISLFIVEPRRFPKLIQFVHILTLPIFGLIIYTIICLSGSLLQSDNIFDAIQKVISIPFLMTVDHIIGASRRYSIDELNEIALVYSLNIEHYYDTTFDYYIIKK